MFVYIHMYTCMCPIGDQEVRFLVLEQPTANSRKSSWMSRSPAAAPMRQFRQLLALFPKLETLISGF